jgi:acetyl esterase/lipase
VQATSFWTAFDAARRAAEGGQPEEAYRTLREVTPLFPDWEATGLGQQAIYASRFDRDLAISVLEDAVSRGFLFSRGTLMDEKFKALFGHERYAALVDRADAAVERARAAARPQMKVLQPSGPAPAAGHPLLLVLHSNNSNMELTEPHWASAADRGYLVALLQSSGLTYDPRFFSWESPAQARDQVLLQLEEIASTHRVDRRRLALGGMSMGAHCALRLALEWIPADLVITYAAFVGDPGAYSTPAATAGQRGLRAYIVIGDQDPQHQQNIELVSTLRAAGVAVEIDERVGLGHAYPADSAQTTALAVTGRAPV